MSGAAQSDVRPYFLPLHVYTCAVLDQVIFLDLRRNRYLSATAKELQGLSRWVRGWPANLEPFGNPTASERSEDDARATIAGLRGQHLVLPCSEDNACSDLLPQPEHQSVRRALFENAIQHYPSISAAHFIRFMKAAAIAKYRLSVWSLYSVVRQVQWRRVRQLNSCPEDYIAALQLLVKAFRRLRPLLPPTRVPCLVNSIALLEFLASYGHFPRLVFGVQVHPFSAHCWLQHEDIVLNTTVENVLNYTPILVA